MLYHFSELKDLLQRAMSVEVGWPNFRFCFDQFVFPQLTLIWGKQQKMTNWPTKLSGQAHFSWVTEWVWNWWFQLFCTFKPSSSWKFSIIVADLSTTTENGEMIFAWVTRPKRPKGAKDEVKRPEGPPPGSPSTNIKVYKPIYTGCFLWLVPP